MPTIRVIFYFLLILTIFSCSKKEAKKSIIFEKSQEDQMIEAYKKGLEELNSGDVIYAARKFNEVEIIYPQSIPRASLMAYSYYSQIHFDDCIIELNRFLKSIQITQIKIMLIIFCLSYYDQMIDETKRHKLFIKQNYFEKVVNDYPILIALDLEFKLNY